MAEDPRSVHEEDRVIDRQIRLLFARHMGIPIERISHVGFRIYVETSPGLSKVQEEDAERFLQILAAAILDAPVIITDVPK